MYDFIYVNVGLQGRNTDGGVTENTTFYDKLKSNILNLPATEIMERELNSVYVAVDLNYPKIYRMYRVIQNDCRGFNNLSYTVHLRLEYMYFFLFNRTTLQVFITYLTAALYVHPL